MSSQLFGLTEISLKTVEQTLKSYLEQKQQWKVDVFGSRGRGTQKKYSDLDLWVESAPPLTANEIQDLLEDFQESDLPIRVDIVTPESVLKEYQANITNEKVPWLRS